MERLKHWSISRSLGMDDFINESWSIYGRNIRNNSWVGVKEGCQITSHMSVISSRLYILVLWLTGLDEKGDQIFKLRVEGVISLEVPIQVCL